ncbi:anhydro-N-acetylmuramic acid kinase [uncultured Chryseobacterium sp.]|uniref:anhydro-N-acetylmuramic acid kinase n=1 Tax=uncultured Chryseobacterium sp. TaxID=259322 RepID=UPI0026296732|nr:anhydro-N-acetylmuramic acid kinase [uncultured Chryseobacterium sp.]
METFFAIGLMSGTSLDGLDLCYVRFERENGTWNFEILETSTLPYSEKWEQKLKNSIHISAEELLELHSEYGFYLGEKTNAFIAEKNISKVDVIASHGHTVFHQPHKKFSTQIGDGRAIKIIAKLPVVYDFRTQDVLMGGNGAPLVPIGDELLFSEYDGCINLGGFSNISLKRDGKRIAFDICPVNIVLNKIAKNFGKKYDENGELSKSGTIIPELLSKLDELEFYAKDHPRSLGIEWVNEHFSPLIQHENLTDVLATCNQHFANQIASTIEKFGLKNVLITGGGSYNTFLIETIQTQTSAQIIIPENTIVEFKEALIFAFMGVLKILGENNVLASATGSSEDHSSGLIA